MKTNEALQKDVQDAIMWEPMLHAAEIGVTAEDGVVTLTGVLDSYRKKMEAENAAKSVAGVNVVVEKIELKFFSSTDQRDDSEIAREILMAFKTNWRVPEDKVKARVEKGWVTLDGQLEWNYQKEAAQTIVHGLFGVKGIINNIIVAPVNKDNIEKNDIEKALIRNSDIYAAEIIVNVLANQVTLTGTVGSLYEKNEAAREAWNAPGVWKVNNELVVEYM